MAYINQQHNKPHSLKIKLKTHYLNNLNQFHLHLNKKFLNYTYYLLLLNIIKLVHKIILFFKFKAK